MILRETRKLPHRLLLSLIDFLEAPRQGIDTNHIWISGILLISIMQVCV